MSTKSNLIRDTFEQLAELGSSTVKQGAKAITSLNPLSPLLEQKNSHSNPQTTAKEMLEKQQGKNPKHTPLDFNKLDQSYKTQDTSELARQRQYFQHVKQEEKGARQELEEEERARKQRMLDEEEIERQKIAQTKQPAPEAHGKERKRGVLGGGRKKATVNPQPAEIKPSTGKQ